MRDLVTALLADLLQPLTGLPGTASAVGVGGISHILRARMEAARDIFIDELRIGNVTLSDVPEEEAASVIYRYARAATEGAARLNLRLLAAVAAGQSRSEGLFADEFLRWADMLAGLRREELLVLGQFIRLSEVISPADSSRDESDAAAARMWSAVTEQLALHQQFTEERTRQICAATTRTGLISVRAGTLDDVVIYGHTELLLRLHRYADIEGVAAREGVKL
ncbi:MAG: hypothetical protein ACTHLT_14875 [Devosia sp.]